jgi:hypothetical protein
MTTSDIKQNEGFKEFTLTGGIEYGSIRRADLRAEFNDILHSYKMRNLTELQRIGLVESFDRYARYTFSKPTGVGDYGFRYKNEQGTMNLFKFHFERDPDDHEEIIINYRTFACTFVPAQPYVIITESEEDIISSSSSQHIEYLPANLTQGHLDTIMGLTSHVIHNYFSTSLGIEGAPNNVRQIGN